jgi:plasmid stabilization system protein ParE
MISVVFDPDARAEFLEAVQYYEDSQTGLGRRFRVAIETAVKSIAENPFRYRVLHPPFRRYLLQNFPYAIIYSIEPENILIIAIAHTKRKPGYWIKRD